MPDGLGISVLQDVTSQNKLFLGFLTMQNLSRELHKSRTSATNAYKMLACPTRKRSSSRRSSSPSGCTTDLKGTGWFGKPKSISRAKAFDPAQHKSLITGFGQVKLYHMGIHAACAKFVNCNATGVATPFKCCRNASCATEELQNDRG